ncbi:MAG: hypothetical protein ABFD97_17175 [Syntrophobacter sp.]
MRSKPFNMSITVVAAGIFLTFPVSRGTGFATDAGKEPGPPRDK